MKNKELKNLEKEKKIIPIMIAKYCKGNHKAERKAQGVKGKLVCAECKELTEYALFRLDKCPFKVNKKFCSFCKIHCYKPEMRGRIKQVMKYSGHRLMFRYPIFCFSHVAQMIKYKKSLKKQEVQPND